MLGSVAVDEDGAISKKLVLESVAVDEHEAISEIALNVDVSLDVGVSCVVVAEQRKSFFD